MIALFKSSLLLVVLIVVRGEEDVISWDDASIGCKNEHNSILLPQQYWLSSKETTTKDILSEMEMSSAAWIDGEVFQIDNEYGLQIKVLRATLHVETALPFVRENGTLDYTPTKKVDLPYNQNYTYYNKEFLEQLGNHQKPEDGLYWIPGMNLNDINDRKCIGLRAINNATGLEVAEYNCTEMKMAVCIDVSLLKENYELQPSLLIEVSKKSPTTHDKVLESTSKFEESLQLQVTKVPFDNENKDPDKLVATPLKALPLEQHHQTSRIWSISVNDLVLGSFIMAGICLILIIVLAVVMCIMCKRLSMLAKDKQMTLGTPESHTYEGLNKKSHSRLKRLSLRGSKKQKQDRMYTTVDKQEAKSENVGYLSMRDSVIYKRRMDVTEGHLTPEDNPYSVIPVDMRKERVLVPQASNGLGETDPKLAIENETFKRMNNDYVGMLNHRM